MTLPRAVLVTGASSGIGEATVRALVADGAHVIAVARRKDRLERLVEELRGQRGSVTSISADLTDADTTLRVVEQAVAVDGRLDGLVNNAGIMLLGPIASTDPAEWDRMLRINLHAVLRLTSAAIPYLLRSAGEPGGVADIVNVSSTAGRIARKGAGAYNASKFALNAFSESLRQELARKFVRVSLVEPGLVLTELTSHIRDETTRREADASRAAIASLGADDVARVIAFIMAQPRHVAINEVLLRPTEQEP
ncbi:MAG: SDR family oxidoreductase [Thermoplasmata archaeon]|jgi:NADP-dependent 3-hydroxy acid dehydrogenase YdfG